MTSKQLENLVKAGQLKQENWSKNEFDGLIRSGRARLNDAKNTALALESRFDLAYNAAHSLSLAALRWHGYRSQNRYIVFQVLPHTLNVESAIWPYLLNAMIAVTWQNTKVISKSRNNW
ncbi:MAG: hypothetical protein U5P41_00085 [Gammaproteobacteria bacterium]|nr:hypothetical protein [Gammaproteobacteria bacterium]